MYWSLELASHLEDAPWPATKEELIDYLSAHQPDVLLTMGAGDIDRLVTKIKERFNE